MRNYPDIFDELLIIKSQEGNQKALDLLVKRWHPRLIKQAFWTTKDMESAKDIAQECWPAIIKGLRRLKSPEKFKVWANKIAYFKSVDWIRSKQKDRENQKKNSEVTESWEQTRDEGREGKVRLLKRMILQLPEEQQSVLRLFYLEEHSIVEIGEILHIPPGTVKSRLFHAREQLKKKLKRKSHEKEL